MSEPKTNFLERNKKKSSLLALLLLWRAHRTAIFLLLLIFASGVLLTPPSWQAHVPFLGRWLSRGGRGSLSRLAAAWKFARELRPVALTGESEIRANGVAPQTPSSVDYVAGSQSDLGGKVPIANPGDQHDKNLPEGVAVDSVGGEREKEVAEQFKDGRFNGSGIGAGALSGGAYADRNLFSGAGGADSSPILLGQTSVGSGSDVTTPQWAVKAGFRGHLSKAAMTAINTRTLAAASAATALKGNKGITQLVEAKGRATFVQQGCGNGSCPGEFAATNSGAVYDGNATTGDGTDILLAPTDPVGTSVPSGARWWPPVVLDPGLDRLGVHRSLAAQHQVDPKRLVLGERLGLVLAQVASSRSNRRGSRIRRSACEVGLLAPRRRGRAGRARRSRTAAARAPSGRRSRPAGCAAPAARGSAWSRRRIGVAHLDQIDAEVVQLPAARPARRSASCAAGCGCRGN